MCIFAVLLVTLTGRPGHAEDNEAYQLAARGNKRAKAGDFEGALELLRQSLAIRPRSDVLCNIGGAYYMLKRWVKAHLVLGICLSRAADLDDADWVKELGKLYAQAELKLKAGAFAPVKIRVTPASARVRIAGLPADASFTGPRTVWLPAGKHTITASAKDHDSAETDVVATKGKTVEAVLTLKPKPKPITVEPPPKPSRTGAYVTWGLGGAALIAGGVFYALALDTNDRAEPLDPSSTGYAELKDEFEFRRLMSYSLLGAGVVASAIGTYLFIRASGSNETSQRAAGAAVTRGGAVVWARWSF